MVERCLPNRFPTWRTHAQPESLTCARPSLYPAATSLAWASPHLRQLIWKVLGLLIPPQPPARCPGCGQASTCRLVIRNRIPPTVSMGMARKSSTAEPETITDRGGWFHSVTQTRSLKLWLPPAPNSQQPRMQGLNSSQPSRNWDLKILVRAPPQVPTEGPSRGLLSHLLPHQSGPLVCVRPGSPTGRQDSRPLPSLNQSKPLAPTARLCGGEAWTQPPSPAPHSLQDFERDSGSVTQSPAPPASWAVRAQ